MALATFDLFARIIAANAAAYGGFDAPAVDHTRAWAGRTPLGQPQNHEQVTVDRLPQTAVAPRMEIALHRGHRLKSRR